MVDGVSGTHLYDVIFDTTPEGDGDGAPDDTWHAAAEPSTLRLAAEAMWDIALNPVEQVRMLGSALRSPRATAGRIVDTARGLTMLAGTLRPVTENSLVGPLGKQRRYSFARASLHDLVDVGHQTGATFNDVVLSVISGGFRAVLRQRHESLDSHAVRSLVPVSVRAPGTEGVYENRISMMLADLPVHLADPVARLKAVHEHLAALKASMEAQAGEAMTTLARHQPYPLISWPLRLAMRMPQRNIVTVTTNVPGPRRPLYLLGRRLVEILPYVPIAYRLRTGVSIFTYGGQVTFGVTGDAANAPEVERLAAAIEAEVHMLIAAHRRADSSTAHPVVEAPPKKAPRKRTSASKPMAGKPAAGKARAPKASTPTRPTAPAKTAVKSRRAAKP
jgi:diacylglycerol O-acyltransferase